MPKVVKWSTLSSLQQIYAAPALVVCTCSSSHAYAAPAPVVEYSSPALAESCAAPAPTRYAVPVSCRALTMTVTGVDLNRDGIPDVLLQHQVWFLIKQYGAPVHTWRGCLQHGGDVVPKDVNAVVATAQTVAGSYVASPAACAAPAPVVEHFSPAPAVTLIKDTRLARHTVIQAETFNARVSQFMTQQTCRSRSVAAPAAFGFQAHPPCWGRSAELQEVQDNFCLIFFETLKACPASFMQCSDKCHCRCFASCLSLLTALVRLVSALNVIATEFSTNLLPCARSCHAPFNAPFFSAEEACLRTFFGGELAWSASLWSDAFTRKGNVVSTFWWPCSTRSAPFSFVTGRKRASGARSLL